MKLVYSTEKKVDVRKQLGQAHYSYGFTSDLYVGALRRAGYSIELVNSPEIFKDRATYLTLLGAEPEEVIHICFRSTENIRLMAGARNIVFFYWEFPVLKDRHLITEAVTADQLHMLKLADELWVSCEFTRAVFESYGLTDVYTVAPPVCGRTRPRRLAKAEALDLLDGVPALSMAVLTGYTRSTNMSLSAAGALSLGQHPRLRPWATESKGRVYLTVCNPTDSRKNLLNVIDGFRLAVGDSVDDVLLLKLIVPNDGNFRAAAFNDLLAPRLRGPGSVVDPRVLVVFEYLEALQMGALYSLADFYVSGSHCEGLNLPLVESMNLGTVPVTTCNTAMCDFITDKNAVIINERTFPLAIDDIAGSVAGQMFDLPIASRFDVAEGILRAAEMTGETWAGVSEASRRTVSSLYAEDAIVNRMHRRFAGVGPRGSRAHVAAR